MTFLFALLAFVMSGLAPDDTFAADRTVVGSIVIFECGDNCYLKIKDDKGNTHDGLCTAPQCQPWNHFAEIPKEYIGKRVRVRVDTGVQHDSAGRVRGRMSAFKEVLFIGE